MKKTFLIITALMLIVGCSKEPINIETTLVYRDDVYYTKDTNKPYSGPVFSLYDDGKKKGEGTFKDGKVDGLATEWYENGQKSWEGTYKDGELISEKCWDKNGNEERCLEEFLKEFEKEKKVLEAKEVIEKKVEKKVEKKIMELREEPN